MINFKTVDDNTSIIFANYKDNQIEVIVDTEDIDRIRAKFQGIIFRKNAYSIYPVGWYGVDSKPKFISLYRFILGITDKNILVDHRDNNTLNNKKSNLRPTNKSGNAQNLKGLRVDNTTGHKNVYYDKHRDKWQVKIVVNGAVAYSKRFNTKEEAVEIAKKKRAEYHPFSKEAQDEPI